MKHFTWIFLFALAACAPSTSFAESKTIDSEKRPVEAAVHWLELIYGVPITYEDTRHDGEMVSEKMPNGKIYRDIKFGAPLTFNYESPPLDAPLEARKKLAGDALREATEKYNSAHGGEIFTITESEQGFHVISRNFVNLHGKVEAFQPALDVVVTIEPQYSGTIYDLIDRFMKEATGLWFGEAVYSNLYGRTYGNILAAHESARAVLERLLGQIQVRTFIDVGGGASQETKEGGYMSWEVISFPAGTHAPNIDRLTIHTVKPPGTN